MELLSLSWKGLNNAAFIRLLACALLAVTVTWSSASHAERRVALVIGNGAYKNVPKLPNPPKDAKSIASLLRNLGFEVVTGPI